MCPSLNETIDSEFISFISMPFNNNHFALSFRVFCVNLLPHACMHTYTTYTQKSTVHPIKMISIVVVCVTFKKNTSISDIRRVCAIVVYASVLFPYGYVFFPFVITMQQIWQLFIYSVSLVKIIFEWISDAIYSE